MPDELPLPSPKPLHVTVERTAGLPWFVVILDSGESEELEPDETRAWFKVRGANMDVVEGALDYCWNFWRVEVTINNPKTPPRSTLLTAPHVSDRPPPLVGLG